MLRPMPLLRRLARPLVQVQQKVLLNDGEARFNKDAEAARLNRRSPQQRCASSPREDRDAVIAFHPAIENACSLFDNSPFHENEVDPWHTYRKLADLLGWLNRRNPRSILELGSGRSSLLLACWAEKHAARFVSFEENPEWRSLVMRAVELAGGRGEIRIVPAVDFSDGRGEIADPTMRSVAG